MILLVYYNVNKNYYRFKVCKRTYNNHILGDSNQYDELLINVIELDSRTAPKKMFGVSVLYK